jgi:CRISPR-associated protein Cmr6
MQRPLYTTSGAVYARGDSHAGLWYDKFCDTWTVADRRWSMTADAQGTHPKLAWIQRVAGDVGRPDLVSEAAHRQVLLAGARGGRVGVFTTESRFVTGTGRSHPVENGFVWHPTLGTPYLPGSSIKGMIRRWAEEAGESPARISAAFGPDDQRDQDDPAVTDDDAPTPRGAGHVIVFDAIPVKPPRVEADVLTPHYANWTPEDPPGDWGSPVPVPFLVTAAGTDFLFAIVRAGSRADAAGKDADTDLADDVWRWLTSALGERGAGAKTAVGYGRFARADAATQHLQQRVAAHQAEARRAADLQTPEGRWRVALDGKPEPDVVGLVRQHLKDGKLTDPTDRRNFARAALAGPFAPSWRAGKPATQGLRQGAVPGSDKLKELHRLLVAAAGTSESAL